MAQNREKDETLDLKVSTETPLSLSCPDNCKKIPSSSPPPRPDLTRFDPGSSDSARLRPAQPQQEEGGGQTERQEKDGEEKRVETAPSKRAVNRCSGCGKRVGLVGFRCKCGDLFCGEHRYSDRHDCGYDYKSAGREAIARENPVVRAAKILKV